MILYDRTLLVPLEHTAKGIKLDYFTNICVHLVPALALLWEISFHSSHFRSHWLHVVLLIIANVAYYRWTLYLYSVNQRWTYPVLGRLAPDRTWWLFGSALLFTVVSYLFGKHV